MNMFISDALAQTGGQGAGGGLLSLLPLVLIFVLFYFLLIRPQQKRTKKHKEMVESLQVKDEVVTGGGLLGQIVSLDDNFVGMEVAKDVIVKVQRHAVTQTMPEGTYSTAAKSSKGKKREKIADE